MIKVSRARRASRCGLHAAALALGLHGKIRHDSQPTRYNLSIPGDSESDLASDRILAATGPACQCPIGRRTKLPVIWRTAIVVLACLGTLVLVVTFTPLVKWWAKHLAGPWNDPKGDILIVLGGADTVDNIIGYSSYLRAQYAVYAYRHDGFGTILISGGGAIPVSLTIRNFLVSQGVPPAIVRVELASTSTHENAVNAKQALAGVPGAKVLLTSDYHMYRAHRAFTKAGLDVLPRPFPDALKRASNLRGRWPVFLDLMVETVKIGYYEARGWI
jgi:uncharacterized SAM-binding protein YcdF (DUF218 family)